MYLNLELDDLACTFIRTHLVAVKRLMEKVEYFCNCARSNGRVGLSVASMLVLHGGTILNGDAVPPYRRFSIRPGTGASLRRSGQRR